MDMKCRKCAEPWDWWYIRDDILKDEDLFQNMKKRGGFIKDTIGLPGERGTSVEIGAPSLLTKSRSAKLMAKEEKEKLAQWQFAPGPYIIQCPACIGEDVEPDPNADIYAALQDVLGDDIDGFMAEMEDLESLGF